MDNFEDELAEIYKTLLDRQEPLGDEFYAAIYENLDDLYES